MISARMLKPINKIINHKDFIIVGAGKLGKQVKRSLDELNKNIVSFLDNYPEKYPDKYEGIEIKRISGYQNKDARDILYIVAINDRDVQDKIKEQLIKIGVIENNIFICDSDVAYNYWKSLPKEKYIDEVSLLYREVFGKTMDWNHPSSYNEIVCYEKVFANDNEKKAILVDKYRARDYVGKVIGTDHLVKYLGVWDSPKDIDYLSLPNRFVLKTNWGSGQNIIIKNKHNIDKDKIADTLRYWMQREYCYYGLAMHYKGITPKIVCEEYLDGLAETEYDYDVFCFHGKPEYICCINGSHRGWARASFYDIEWNKLEGVSFGWPYDPDIIPRPEQLDTILDFSRKLSKEFKHVRVDWYIHNGQVLFSEMTFATWGGLERIIPEKWDYVFGDLINNKIHTK